LKKYKEIESDLYVSKWIDSCIQECSLFAWEPCEWIHEDGADDEIFGSEVWIMTWAGSLWNRLRYYVSIYKKDKSDFTLSEQNLIWKSFFDISFENDSIIEKIDWKNDIWIISLLMPLDISLDDLVMKCIADCNKNWEIVLKWYWAENTKYPTDQRLLECKDFLHDQDEKWLL